MAAAIAHLQVTEDEDLTWQTPVQMNLPTFHIEGVMRVLLASGSQKDTGETRSGVGFVGSFGYRYATRHSRLRQKNPLKEPFMESPSKKHW